MNLLDLMVKIGVDDQASSRIGGIASGITGKLGSAAAAVGKVMAGVGAAAGAGAVAIGKAAVESYASYEQLAGGVDKLYQGASDKVKQYAQNAYRTAGMSANQYMEQATSFSASLINSLGGDTEKAAEQTDKAMRLMSDNVNTFGSNMGDVQNAIQGLSRENYTMLDNLKLGYAGTKEGMQQLIDDANEYAKQQGINADLTMGNFSDMIDAIDLIQQKQHIWGTTAKEAMTTIEGSVNATKAAWENFLTAIGAGDQDMIGQSVRGMIDGIFGTFNDEVGKREGGIIANVLPIVQNVGNALVGEMPGLAEGIVWNLLEAINDAFGTDIDVEGLMTSLENAFSTASERVGTLLEGLGGAFEAFTSTIDMNDVTAALEMLGSIGEQVWGFIESNILPNLPMLGEVIGNIANFLLDVGTTLLTVMTNLGPIVPMIAGAVAALAGLSAIAPIIASISEAITFFTTVLVPALGMIQSVPGLIAVVTTVLGGPITIIAAIAGAIIAFVATNEEARNAVIAAVQAVIDFFMGLPEFFAGVWESIKAGVAAWVAANMQKWEELKANTSQAFENIKQSVIGAFENAKQSVIEAAANIYEGVSNKFNEVVDFVAGIPGRILGALGDLGSLLWNAGSSIISGLWDGMSAVADDLFNWVSGIAGTIASLKGPLPYDKKVLIDNGLALMAGLQSGIAEGFEQMVMPYVSAIAGEMQSGMTFGDIEGPTIRTTYRTAERQPTMTDAERQIITALRELRQAIPTGVYLDGNTLVGQLAPDMSRAIVGV